MYKLPKSIPEMIPVKSSNVKSVGYDDRHMMLYVQFLGGEGISHDPMYRYYGVSSRIYNDMLKASSKGNYVWTTLKGNYKYAKWTGFGWKKDVALKMRAYAKRTRKKKQTARIQRELKRRSRK